MPRAALLSLATFALLAAGCAAPREAAPAPGPTPAAGQAPAAAEIRSVEPSKDYPIDFCVVSRESLMEDGHPVAITCNGVEVQFCCKDCVAKFKADPEKYLAVLNEAKAAKTGK